VTRKTAHPKTASKRLIDPYALAGASSPSPPLVWPRHWKVDETLQAVAARQAPFDCSLDDVRGEECK
jgi:hypothetical protein